jgi:hypothetical protein
MDFSALLFPGWPQSREGPRKVTHWAMLNHTPRYLTGDSLQRQNPSKCFPATDGTRSGVEPNGGMRILPVLRELARLGAQKPTKVGPKTEVVVIGGCA